MKTRYQDLLFWFLILFVITGSLWALVVALGFYLANG